MFLATARRRLRRDDEGSTLLAVVGLMAVTAIIGVTVANVTVNALTVTSVTRANLQAQAAAESGVNVAVANMRSSTSTCTSPTVSTTTPAYSVTISYTTSSTLTAGTAWIPGCPSASAKYVKMVSAGSAQAKGAGAASSGDVESIEAIYEYTTTTTAIAATGGASYSYQSGNLNNLTLLDGGNLNSDIRIRTGSVTCQTGTVINGSVFLGAGYFESNGGCKINGNVNVSDYAFINTNSSVLGAVSAHGSSLKQNQYAAYIAGTGVSGGNGKAVTLSVIAGGAVYIDGKVGGSVTSGPLPNGATPAESTITPNSTTLVGGNITGTGTFASWASRCTTGATGWDAAGNACAIKKYPNVTGTISFSQTGLTNPAAPAMAPWVDYTYNAADWTALGFTIVVWSASQCQINNDNVGQSWVTALSSYTTPTVIDTTACSGFDFSQSANLTLSLKTDIAFIAKKFDIGKLIANSNNTTQRKMWFIVSDPTVNASPDCTNGGNIDIKNDTKLGSTISALAYTPCLISNSAATWSGQMYGKTVNFDTGITLTFRPVGLPNVDFDTGVVTTTTTSTTSGLGNRVSIRDIG